MLRKVIIGAVLAILLVGAVNLWAEQAEKKLAKKQEVNEVKKGKAGKGQKRGDLLAKLTKAYEQKDMEKIGRIIEQMKQRREKIQKARRTGGESMQRIRKGRRAGRRDAGQFRGGGMYGKRLRGFGRRDMDWRCQGCPAMRDRRPRGRGMGGGCPMAWNRGMGPQHQRFGQSGYGWRGQQWKGGRRASGEFGPQGFGGRRRGPPAEDLAPASEWDW